jgi:predicted CXXCH cytochrome family protein
VKDSRPGSPGSIGTINLEIGTIYSAQILPESDRVGSHPTGIPYRGSYRYEGLGDTPENAFVTGDPPAVPKPLVGFKPAEGSVIDQEPVWWLDTGGTGRQRTDIHLYTRFEEDGQPRPYIECSSCHDPHAETYMFLRLADKQSTICLACHDV